MSATGGNRRRLRVAILDLVSKGPSRKLYARVMAPNLASIMPQVVAVWCQQLGHEVRFVCYTGFEDLSLELAGDADILFIGAFTCAAQTAYAISNLYRRRGAITVLGGPHARCYPEDAARYFDYVLGFTDKATLEQVLRDCAPHRPFGLRLGASRQPLNLPSVQERWQFIEPTLAKAPTFKLVPMIGSMGCPYTCSFCIDSVVDYQPLDFAQIRDDLRFLLGKMQRPRVAWHDPNFGVRFNDYMTTIEEAVPPGRIDFIAESSLSLLSEPNLRRLRNNGFKGMLPGIESWYSLGNKSKTGRNVGRDKVIQVSDHINTDPRIHSLRPGELRSRFGCRRRAGVFRVDQAVPGPLARRFSRIFSVQRVRTSGAAQPRATSRGAGSALSVPFSRQQSSDECPPEAL